MRDKDKEKQIEKKRKRGFKMEEGKKAIKTRGKERNRRKSEADTKDDRTKSQKEICGNL